MLLPATRFIVLLFLLGLCLAQDDEEWTWAPPEPPPHLAQEDSEEWWFDYGPEDFIDLTRENVTRMRAWRTADPSLPLIEALDKVFWVVQVAGITRHRIRDLAFTERQQQEITYWYLLLSSELELWLETLERPSRAELLLLEAECHNPYRERPPVWCDYLQQEWLGPDLFGKEPAVESDEAKQPPSPSLEGQSDESASDTALERFEVTRHRPIAVVIDNPNPAFGHQAGLKEASVIYEMPVEGYVTRLMAIYDSQDPTSVGPIGSATDYLHAVVEDIGGVFVHIGGSPNALNAIALGRSPSLDALRRDNEELYARVQSLEAPYNLFSSGQKLREAVVGRRWESSRTLRSEVYRPGADAGEANQLQVTYPGGYSSGFSYLPELNVYRWQRNGQNAVDASGEAIIVEAVVVAQAVAQPFPGDPQGRLYLPLTGGNATLYLNGKAIPGSWQRGGGLQFATEAGQHVALFPFKHWIMFVPSWAELSEQ